MSQGGAERRSYERPAMQRVGSVADLTKNGFSKGNDVGKGKSGGGKGLGEPGSF